MDLLCKNKEYTSWQVTRNVEVWGSSIIGAWSDDCLLKAKVNVKRCCYHTGLSNDNVDDEIENSRGQVAAFELHKQGLGNGCMAEIIEWQAGNLDPQESEQWVVHHGIPRDKIYGQSMRILLGLYNWK